MAKIQFNLPNGYSAEVTAAKESGTFNQWIDGKFADRTVPFGVAGYRTW